jgi:phosphatidylinositol alpha-1,6-mannosyltransferase
MKILILTWNYPPVVGGIEQVAHHTAGGLFHRGHSVRVIAPALPAGLHEATEYDIPVYRAGKPGIPQFLIHAVLSSRRLIRASRPDVLLCPSLTSAPAAWLLSRRFHIPYAIQIHGSDILLPRHAYQLAIAPLLSGARMLFANSRNTANLLEKRGLDPKRIRVVCPGVTPPPPPTAQPTPGILRLLEQNAGRPTLVTVGRLVRRKGIQEFIAQTLPLLRERIPNVLYLVVGGEPKASLIHHERMGGQLADAVRTGRHEDHVKLLGRLSDADLDCVYRRASLFVLPCLDDPNDVEGFGIVILEAALKGVPAIATRSGGIPDAIANEETGVLVPPGNPRALADALADLLRDPARTKKLGETARRRTLAEFTWNTIAARYEAGLRESVDSAVC